MLLDITITAAYSTTVMMQKHYEVAKALLEQGADPNIRAMDGSMPLIKAAKSDQKGMAKLLLVNGASCNGVSAATGKSGSSELDHSQS